MVADVSDCAEAVDVSDSTVVVDVPKDVGESDVFESTVIVLVPEAAVEIAVSSSNIATVSEIRPGPTGKHSICHRPQSDW